METLTKKVAMYKRIEKHGINLNKIFHTSYGPIVLCKKLRRLELKAHKLATDYCNGEDGITTDNFSIYADTILLSVDRILNHLDGKIPIFVNGDARGYALKIDDNIVREQSLEIYRDWGGYGIIAPDLTED